MKFKKSVKITFWFLTRPAQSGLTGFLGAGPAARIGDSRIHDSRIHDRRSGGQSGKIGPAGQGEASASFLISPDLDRSVQKFLF